MPILQARRVLVLAMALVASGCATSPIPALRARHLASRLEHHEYTKPLSEVWPQAEQVLFSRGLKFRTLNTGGDERTLETEDHPFPEREDAVVRYLVQGRQGQERCRIVVTRRIALPSGEAWTDRDTELELAILRQVDTRTASTIWLDAERLAEAEDAKLRK